MQGERINVIEMILTYTSMHVSVFTYIDIHTYVYNAQYVDIISYIFYSSNSYQGHLMSSDTPT